MKDANSVKAGWTLDNEIVTVRGHRRGAPVLLVQSVPRHRRVTRYSSSLFTQTLLLYSTTTTTFPLSHPTAWQILFRKAMSLVPLHCRPQTFCSGQRYLSLTRIPTSI